MVGTVRARVLAGALAVGSALTACSGADEQPAPTLPPVTKDATPTRSAQAVPTEATAQTPEGAAEFAQFYAEAVAQAYLTRDSSTLERLSDAACEACRGYIRTVRALIASDATVGPSYKIAVMDAVSSSSTPAAGATQVTVTFSQGEFVVTSTSGQELAREPARDRIVQDFTLSRTDKGWKVLEVRTA